jgi:hypothetical protein
VPTIVTRGVASARGAGTFSAAPPPPPPTPTPPPPGPPPVFQTVTFGAGTSSIWTAPTGVSTILNLQVAGGLYSEVPGDYVYYTVYGAAYVPSSDQPGSPGAFYTYAQAGAYADGVLAAANSGGTGDRYITLDPLLLSWNSSTGGYFTQPSNPQTYLANGVAERVLGPWDNRSSSPVGGPGQPPVEWGIGFFVYTPGGEFPGTPSSAFGRTAAGTTSAGQPQIITSASSVSVTPGQAYQIIAGGASGYVQFQFSQQ